MNTPRYGHASISMSLKSDEDQFNEVGQFAWSIGANGQRVLVLAIPHNNPSRWILTEWTIDHRNDCGAQWSWDGNETAPTLSPSLHAVGIWHGWVRGGQLVEA